MTIVISALLAAGPAAAQDLTWPDQATFAAQQIPAASRAADTLGGCPKLSTLRSNEAYPDFPPAVREVSEFNADSLPLPQDDMDRASLLEVMKTSLDYWNGRPDSARITIAGASYDAPRMRRTLAAMIEILSADMPAEETRKAIKSRFNIYRASADDGTGKTVITGYYEAEIPVSRTRDAVNKYPILLKPADLVKATADMNVDFDYGRYDANGKLVKYYSTQEIHAGALDNKNLEIVWSAHPAQIMLLQIQGSGVLRFADGDFIRAGFEAANGQPFRSVQRALMDCGEIGNMSFKTFISYLSSQPQEREERLIDINPRYIFFRAKAKDSLPYGAIGRALTPGRSVAVDPQYIPYGLPGLLKSKRPVAQGTGLVFKDFTRFINTHDTGSAIRGPGRVDLFWGSGPVAETEASSMKASGELYLFVIK